MDRLPAGLAPTAHDRVASLPRVGSSDDVIGDAVDLKERFERIAKELFAFYERGGAHIEVDVRERGRRRCSKPIGIQHSIR